MNIKLKHQSPFFCPIRVDLFLTINKHVEKKLLLIGLFFEDMSIFTNLLDV